MKIISKTFLSCFILLLFAGNSPAQLPYGLYDGTQDGRCVECINTIRNKPPEVLFGIDIHANGDVYFSMGNKQWFDKIFNSDIAGLSVDVVSMDRYACNKETPAEGQLLKGFLLPPLYRPDFKKNMKDLSSEFIMIKVGKVPANMLNKQLEGNLVILYANRICYYTNFVNIDRNVWGLLPMGLYTDSLVNISSVQGNSDSINTFFTYEKKIQLEVPFEKNKTDYRIGDMEPLYDSIDLQHYQVKKIEVRAYSSVEGDEMNNSRLMKGRANAVIKALKVKQPLLNRVNVTTAENWLDFLKDVKGTEFEPYAALSKTEIKRKLADKAISEKMEPILARHRKAIITVYLAGKTAAAGIAGSNILLELKKTITEKDIPKARMIQKELVNRIADNQLPAGYIDQLEVPESKDYMPLLADREIYKYLLHRTSEYEALENFLALRTLDSTNGRLNYNICALRFFAWQYISDSLNKDRFLADINQLAKQDIDSSLIKRMLINYQIMMCGEYMRVYNYNAKNMAVTNIFNAYKGLQLNDDDLYSLVKYFAFYQRFDWAQEIVSQRVNQLNVSENIVFYYVNLGFYKLPGFDIDKFRVAIINAINLDRERFCNFFLPNHKGGASMQLLGDPFLKKFYCESCTTKPISSHEVALNK